MTIERADARIVISDYTFAGHTGSMRTITQHLRFFAAFGWEPRLFVSVITPQRRREIECPVVRVPTLKLGGFVKRVSHGWFADRLARRWNADLVWGHGNLLRQDVLSLHNCLHLTSERLTGKASGSSHAKMHDLQLKRHDSFRHIIANSLLMKNDLIERYAIDAARITVIYPGFDPDTFGFSETDPAARRSERAALGIDPSAFTILFATSGAYEKRGVGRFLDGLASFLGACGEDRLRKRPVTALLIGKADETVLDARVRERGIENHVRYLSTVERIERYYRSANVLVHSAVVEEFGQVIQEAAVSGCPVIASKWVGATELFGSELADYVMDEPTPEAIATRLYRVYDSSDHEIRKHWIERLSSEMKSNDWQRNSELSHRLCLDVLRQKRAQRD